MDEEISVPRFPILGFRIPKSVWRMGNPEYRTMRSGGRGAHMGGRERATGTGDGGGVGHGMSNANSGVGHWMTDGVPGCLVLNRKGPTLGTDTLGEGVIDWPTHEPSGRAIALGRKESGRGCRHPRGNKKPRRVEPTGRGGGDWITYRCPLGR